MRNVSEEGVTDTHDDHGLPRRPADFETMTQALDYAAKGSRGFNFFDARAQLTQAYPFADLHRDALACARRLVALGMQPGDRVALLAESCAGFAATFFGALYAGVLPVPLPLPTSFGGREAFIDQLQMQLRSCDPKCLFSPPDLRALAEDAAAPVAVRVEDWDSFATLDMATGDLPRLGPDDIAYLQYSSGSTRFPQGVMITHRALLANLHAHAISHDLRDSDRLVSWLPWYHDMGLVGCMLSPIASQLSTDYLATESFARRPLSWLHLLSRKGATYLAYSPTFGYDICARRVASKSDIQNQFDLSRWRVAGNGADMIRPDVMQAFVDAFAPVGFDPGAFMPSYGLAEATLAVSISPVGQGIVTDLVDERLLSRGDWSETQRGSSDQPVRYRAIVNCGHVVPGHELEVRDARGHILPDHQVGRLFFRGPSVMSGYFRDAEATKAALVDGWLDTGDMGYLLDGSVYIVGRAKDMIIINGKNHWPQDIEWAVEQLSSFRSGDIAAFSVTRDDGEEVPVILVHCRVRDDAARAELRAAIKARVRAVTGMSCIVELIPPHTLPRTSSGKLSRSKARRLYLSGEIQPLDAAA